MELTTCPNCGSPNSTVKRKKNKHKGVIISIIVFAIIVVSALGIGNFVLVGFYFRNTVAEIFICK